MGSSSQPESLWGTEVGSTATVAAFADQSSLLKKFLALGIRVGAEVTVTQRRRGGLVARSGGTRIALSREMALTILVAKAL